MSAYRTGQYRCRAGSAVAVAAIQPRELVFDIFEIGLAKVLAVTADLPAPHLERFGVGAVRGRENAAVEFSRSLHRLHAVEAGKFQRAAERRLVDGARRSECDELAKSSCRVAPAVLVAH